MAKTITSTRTETYTKPRIDVIGAHFELFIRCAGMNDKEVDKFLKSVENHELKAVGIYIQEEDCRVAEVEFEIDWEEHLEQVHIYGEMFDTDLPGWKEGVAPEAYVLVSRLVKAAKEQNIEVHSWIMVSDFIRQSEEEHKRVCAELGYCFGGKVPEWKDTPKEDSRKIEGLQEAKVTSRQVI